MSWTRVRNALLLVAGILATVFGTLAGGPSAAIQLRPGWTVGTMAVLVGVLYARLSVVVGSAESSTVGRVLHTIASAAGVLMPVLVVASTSFATGSKAAVASGLALTLLGDLAKVGTAPSPPRDKQGGQATPAVLFMVLLVCAVLLFVLAVFSPMARADTPISKCWSSVCANPMVAVTLTGMRLDTKEFVAGILPAGAVGYGVQLRSGYAGLGGFLTASAGGGGGSSGYLQPTILAEVMRVGAFGVSWHYGKDASYWMILFGGSLTSTLNLAAQPSGSTAGP